MNPKRMIGRVAGGGVLVAALLAASTADAKMFSGFNGRFNLGRSASSGAVCEAVRNFDDPLAGDHVRAWDVSCRGWSQKLGRIYLFEGAKSAEPPQAWRAAVAGRATCDFAKTTTPSDLEGGKAVACKTGAAKLDYVLITVAGRRGVVAAEGLAPIADVLSTGVKFVSRSIPEPAAIAEQTASVSQVAGSQVSALALVGESGAKSIDSRREEAYRRNQEWRFDDAEAVFAELASQTGDKSASPAVRAEALYNFALNVSNKGRFAEADVYFKQADDMTRDAGLQAGLGDLALNYRAAHARNQRHYEEAITFADDAIAARRDKAPVEAAVKDEDGVVRITDVGGDVSAARLSTAQRNTLRDAQAIQIKATSLEALGRRDEAREVLRQGVALLDQPLFPGDPNRKARLGSASPWLNARLHADELRLEPGARTPEAMAPLKASIDSFSRKYPGSLPLAGFLIGLAHAESAAGQDDQALAHYETAFDIFRKQRGSMEASADLVGNYFDILLKRIGGAPAEHPQEVDRFFTAAQTLIAPSSAEAAKRQAARVMSGDTAAAGLARALDDTGRSIDVKRAEIRDLQQRAAYQGDAKAKADSELTALIDQSHTLEQQLLQADPRYASALRSVVGLGELQKVLRPGEAYVKVFILANRGYGLLITPDRAQPYAVELTREQAQAMVDGLRKPIDLPRLNPEGRRLLGRYDVALAHDAFVKLFNPVQGDLLAAKLIIYEPDATLIGAPISALVVDDASVSVAQRNLEQARATHLPLSYVGVAWLGARVPSSIALSPAAFMQVRAAPVSKAPDAFFGFGDPIVSQDPRAFARVTSPTLLTSASMDYCSRVRQSLYNLDRLPQTAAEVQSVAASLGQNGSTYSLGEAFTDSDVMRRGTETGELARYKVLYFATHGLLPPPNGCLQPSLLTSLGATGDGLIDVTQIPRLNLDADMVVLSACDTGRSAGGGGDALGGLVATFVQAGARNVVVSNWSVDTVATERLMEAMFTAKGQSQAQAMSTAEQALMSSPDQYSHPFFWAAFTVVGDGARPMPAN